MAKQGDWIAVQNIKEAAEKQAWKEINIYHPNDMYDPKPPESQTKPVGKEYTGGSVSYYRVTVSNPTNKELSPYVAECNDIIEALKMTYAEGNAFKAIWRRCAAQNLGLGKEGYKDGKYDAEKVEFFGKRMVEQSKKN